MDKITVLCASVKGRESSLKITLKSIYDKVDEIHLTLNWYKEVPEWIKNLNKIKTYLNPDNRNAHDAVWFRAMGLQAIDQNFGTGRYYFIIDDDLLYPPDYVDKMIKAIERHKRRAVITAHGSNIVRPVQDYFQCRKTYGFSDALERDIFVDMAGVGVLAFHSHTIKPNINDFPFPYCRDLFFSILCRKKNVKIISLQRPAEWIMPLKVEGDTVYEMSRTNDKLKQLKDRILKEQLLPMLFCSQSDEFVLITDYNFDERLTGKCLETLNKVNPNCNKVIFTNELKSYKDEMSEHNNFLTQFVNQRDFEVGRMGSKMLTQYRFIRGLPEGSKVISGDADLYYVGNPFEAFEQEFDVAVTTRPYAYQYPINGGVVMFRNNYRVRNLLNYLMSQIFDRTWQELIKYQSKFGHSGNDWYIDQDIWCCCWLYKNLIKEMFDVNIIDIGPKYNFCPHADGNETLIGKGLLIDAYQKGLATILHLKSKLKECLFDGDIG